VVTTTAMSQNRRGLANIKTSFSWKPGDDIATLIDLKRACDEMEVFSPKSAKSQASVGASSAASRMLYAEPEQTLMFLDWDDTLFPTTDIFDIWQLSSKRSTWPDLIIAQEQERELEEWRNSLFHFLTMATSLSDRVCIVTNSKRPWVTDCVRFFAPNLMHFFENGVIRVVYAMEVFAETKKDKARPVRYNDSFSSDASKEEFDEFQTNAKFAAMKMEATSFYSEHEHRSWKNILSIGDLPYEADALREVTFTRNSPRREQIRTKTVSVAPHLSVSGLATALKFRSLYLPACVHFNGDFDIRMTVSGQRNKQIVGTALNIPELVAMAECMPAFNYDERLQVPEDVLEDALNDVAVAMQNAWQ